MSQYRIISIFLKNINIVNRAKEGSSLITKKGALKKICVFVSTL